MNGRSAVLAVALFALAPMARGQEPGEGGSDPKQRAKTVSREEVRTWTITQNNREWSVRPSAQTYDGDTGLFRLSSAYGLPRGKVAFSLYRGNQDRDPKGVDFSVHGFTLAYGVSDRLEVFASGGLQNRAKVNYASEPGYPNDYPFIGERWETGFGDVKLGIKFSLLNDYQGDPLGLALRGVVKLPTADEAKGLGTGKASFVADLVASKTLGYAADLHASLGYELNGEPDGAQVANAFRWGIGVNVPACRLFQLQAEVTGRVFSGSTPKQTNVVDLIVGPAIWLRPGWFIRPALSYAINYDGRGRDVSFGKRAGKQIEIGYHPGTPCCEVVTPPPPPPPPANRPPTVNLDCAKESLLAGESTPCTASAADPDGDSLTYAWSTSAGRTTGSGAIATLDTAGTTCGTAITVGVTVADGRGGTASATDSVRIVCPQALRPEAVTCTSGGFPRNMSRLNNVDKACLDDVASRLRQDPRSRVIVVGYADARERNPEVLGRTRAEAVKTYLMRERGVEEARITARSAGSARALETGPTSAARLRNSRVEVIFLPEGATAPDND